MTFDLNSWETKIVLESLRTLDAKWNAIIDGTEDEDIQSEYGNDLAQLQLLQERMETQAIEEFGAKVKEFSRHPIGTTPKS
jgi:hypothetical protein